MKVFSKEQIKELMPKTVTEWKLSNRELLHEYFRQRDKPPHVVDSWIQGEVDEVLRKMLETQKDDRCVVNLEKDRRKAEKVNVSVQQCMAAEVMRLELMCPDGGLNPVDAVAGAFGEIPKTVYRALERWRAPFTEMGFVENLYMPELRRRSLIR